MKAGVIGILIVVLIAAAAGFFFLYQTPKSPEPSTQTQQEDKLTIEDSQTVGSNLSIGSNSTNQNSHGFYEFHSQDAFGGLIGKKVLFFYASWCPECKEADEDFKANINKIPENVHIFKVHYNDPQTFDEDKDFAKKYGITYQHTFVQIDDNGNEITKWNGGGLDNLLSKIK